MPGSGKRWATPLQRVLLTKTEIQRNVLLPTNKYLAGTQCMLAYTQSLPQTYDVYEARFFVPHFVGHAEVCAAFCVTLVAVPEVVTEN